MRKNDRLETQLTCGLVHNNKVIQGSMLNFSRTGALVKTSWNIATGKFVSLMYQNEKNEMIRILTMIVHCKQRGSRFETGLLFLGVESRA